MCHTCYAGALPFVPGRPQCKSVARAMPVFLQVTTQRIADKYKGDISDVFMALHGYRTDTGVDLETDLAKTAIQVNLSCYDTGG